MEQSAIIRTVRHTVRPVEDRLKSARMRLHLPRRRARDELRAWLPAEELEDIDMVGASPPPAAENQI
ncbi:MAG TPA: hypothetical protein VHO06_14635 [Polyangia bacterium]|nr:hypothetical protein [Polyangia bacterium]